MVKTPDFTVFVIFDFMYNDIKVIQLLKTGYINNKIPVYK